MTSDPGPSTAGFRWYLCGLGGWFAAAGLGNIMFPWLVAVVLHETPERVGLAQMALMAPPTLLLLLGGAIADRSDCRALLVRFHLLAMAPPLALAVVIVAGAASYPVLLGYGLATGAIAAFVTPARDALLSRIVGADLARAIAVATVVQFACQLAGIALAGTAGRTGAPPLLALQALLLGAGAITTWRLAAAPPTGQRSESRRAAMHDGLLEVWRSPVILPAIVAIAAVGVLYVGTFFVVIPLLVREAYHGGSAALAALSACFWGGTIAATLVQVRVGALRRPGRAMLVAITLGVGVLAAMAVEGAFALLAGLCLLWGVGAGVTMTQGRTIVQLAAPESHRARAMAVFQLGLFGGAPIGAIAMGYLVAAVGPRLSVLFPAVAMLFVMTGLLLRSGIWRADSTRLRPRSPTPAADPAGAATAARSRPTPASPPEPAGTSCS